MKNRASQILLTFILIGAAIVGAPTTRPFAQSGPADPIVLTVDFANQRLKASFLTDTQIEGRRAVAMAKGIAADKFTWKPASDANAAANRTMANLFLHLAFSFWTRPGQFGAAPPEGFDVKQKADEYENSTTDRAKIVEQLTQSFAYAENAIRKVPASDLPKHVKLNNGRDSTVAAVMAAMVEFDSEHVGQLMIYSRINGFIPPTPGQVATPEDGK